MADIASLLLQYLPPQVVFTAVVVWVFARLTFKTKDAKDTAIRSHRRIDRLEVKIEEMKSPQSQG
jgi:hypothetical protein